jgi:hypothetical protein
MVVPFRLSAGTLATGTLRLSIETSVPPWERWHAESRDNDIGRRRRRWSATVAPCAYLGLDLHGGFLSNEYLPVHSRAAGSSVTGKTAIAACAYLGLDLHGESFRMSIVPVHSRRDLYSLGRMGPGPPPPQSRPARTLVLIFMLSSFRMVNVLPAHSRRHGSWS